MPEAPPQDLIAHSQKKKLGRPIVEHQGHPFHEALAERGMNVAKWARTRNYVSSDGKVSGRVYNWLSRGFPADVAAEIKKDFGIDVPVSAEPSKKPKTRHS